MYSPFCQFFSPVLEAKTNESNSTGKANYPDPVINRGNHVFDRFISNSPFRKGGCRVEQFLISLAVVLLLLAFGTAAIGAFLIGLIVGEIHKLTTEHQEQKERIRSLEELQPKRLTHNLAAGLEDEIAVLGDVARHMEAYLTRINSALEVARDLRGNPDGYDQDKPAGRRPKVME
jgi:hypothetical protein